MSPKHNGTLGHEPPRQSRNIAHNGAARFLTLRCASETGTNVGRLIPPGTELAEFVVQSCVHEGQCTAVFKAHRTRLGGEVALKIAIVDEKDASGLLEFLVREFRALDGVTNTKHVVRVYDPRQAQFNGMTLLLMPMEYADHGNLRAWLDANPDTEARRSEALRLFREACQGVQALHHAGITAHLDIKPENILLFGEGPTAKLADAEIALFTTEPLLSEPDSRQQSAIGTPEYMSPEQFEPARQGEIGPASDIYSLGVILFELLVGTRPFDSGDWGELKRQHVSQGPPDVAGTGNRWSGTIKRCLSKEPGARFQTAEALLRDLDRIDLGGLDIFCPHCGHVNTEEEHGAWKSQCQKCEQVLPSDFFRRCPRCKKPIRVDVDRCPLCDSDIAIHYRWAQINRALEEDLDRASELICKMLTENLGDREELSDLNSELETKQNRVEELRQHAGRLYKQWDLEQARTNWIEVLGLVPRHVIAKAELSRIEALLDEEATTLANVRALMDEALFDEAVAKLTDRLATTPGRRKVSATLEECKERRSRYQTHLPEAQDARRNKRICNSQQHVDEALRAARTSPDALTLQAENSTSIQNAESLLTSAETSIAAAAFAAAEKDLSEARDILCDMPQLGHIMASLTVARANYPGHVTEATSALDRADYATAQARIGMALQLCPQSPEARSLKTRIDREKAEVDARRARFRAMVNVFVGFLVVATCVFLAGTLLSCIRDALYSRSREQTLVVQQASDEQKPTHQEAAQTTEAPLPQPATAPQKTPVPQVTLSGVGIPEEVVTSGMIVNHFGDLAQSNGNVVVVSLADALTLEKALMSFAATLDGTVRRHWVDSADRFRRRRDGESPVNYGVERDESRRMAFRQAMEAFQDAAKMFELPLIRNRNGQWIGPTWAYCITQPIYPDGYQSHSHGGGVLKFRFPYRSHAGNSANWINLSRATQKFKGNVSAAGGWMEMMASGPSEADTYIGNRMGLKLDMLLIPAVQIDATSGTDRMHDSFTSKHAVILARIRLRWIGETPRDLFDISCEADQSIQGLDWKNTLNYQAIPAWPTGLP